MDYNELIGRNLSLFRDVRKWSLQEVVERLEKEQHILLSVIELQAYEQGQPISAELLHRLARILRININELYEEAPIFS